MRTPRSMKPVAEEPKTPNKPEDAGESAPNEAIAPGNALNIAQSAPMAAVPQGAKLANMNSLKGATNYLNNDGRK